MLVFLFLYSVSLNFSFLFSISLSPRQLPGWLQMQLLGLFSTASKLFDPFAEFYIQILYYSFLDVLLEILFLKFFGQFLVSWCWLMLSILFHVSSPIRHSSIIILCLIIPVPKSMYVNFTIYCLFCHFDVVHCFFGCCGFWLWAAHLPWDWICENSLRPELQLSCPRETLYFLLPVDRGTSQHDFHLLGCPQKSPL